jgi:hypothetical protein
MTKFSWTVAIACFLLFRSATAQTAAPAVDLTGRWAGQYSGGTILQPIRGTVTMTLRQVGSDVTGRAVVTDTRAPASLNGGLKGTVRGNTFSWVTRLGRGQATVRGKWMTGFTRRGTTVNLARQ